MATCDEGCPDSSHDGMSMKASQLHANVLSGLHTGHAGEAARARLQAPLLRQCMQAFKAALPKAQLGVFRTFLRQHQEALGLDSQVIDSHQARTTIPTMSTLLNGSPKL